MPRIPLLLAVCLALGGCSSVKDAIAVASSPQATQAAANVGKLANAFECFVAATSGAVNDGLTAGGARGQTATRVVYVISADLCTSKYAGATGAAVAVPAAQVVTQ